jgi:hypothetical protein
LFSLDGERIVKKWRILMNGTNFRMELEDESGRRVRRMGFVTNVFLTARTPREAELRAVAVLRRDKYLRSAMRNDPGDPPLLFADKIEGIASFKGCRQPRQGLAFYPERGPRRKR